MERRTFLATLAGGLLAAPLAVLAQPAEKVYRLGYLSAGAATGNPRLIEVFRQGLREHGWVEGQNIVIDYRWAEGRFDRLPDLAAELVGLKVDVIAASPTPAALAAKKVTGTIPIVGMGLTDPVGLGIIVSLAPDSRSPTVAAAHAGGRCPYRQPPARGRGWGGVGLES